MASSSKTTSNLSLSDLEQLDDMKYAPKDYDQILQNMLTQESMCAQTIKMIVESTRYGLNLDVAAEIGSQAGNSGIVPKVVPLTAVMDYYASAGRTSDAFKVFLKMLANGITPNAYTYTVIIKALASCSPRDPNFPHFVKFAKMYFVEMLDKGLQPTPGTYIALSEKLDEGRDRKEFGELIKAKGFVLPPDDFHTAERDQEIPFITEGLVEAAFRQRKVFEDATKDTNDKEMQQTFEKMRTNWIVEEAWRMYHGLLKDSQVDQANEFYKQNKRGIIPDVAIHTVVIEAYANAGKAKGALKAYKHMLANGVDPNLYTYSILIKALTADLDFVLTARKYFLEMLDKGIIPNSDIYEAVSKGAKAEDREYMEFAEAVLAKGIKVLKEKDVSGKEGDREDLGTILLMLECGIPCKAESYNMIIRMLAFHNPCPSAVQYAKKYFLQMLEKGMQPDSGTYTLVMEAIACQSDSKAKVIEEAREFMKQIKDKGLLLDNPSYFEFHDHLEDAVDTFRMFEYATRTDDEEMKEIFLKWRTNREAVMKFGFDMLSGLVDDGYGDEALELFEPVFETGIYPPIVLHTAIIQAYVDAGKMKGAFEAYLRMLAAKITPNFYTYSVLIKALSADPNLFKSAKVNLLDMMKKKMHPNAGTYTAVFEGFARQGDKGVEEGREFLNEMKGNGFEPNEGAVREVLRGRKGEVVEGVMEILFDKSHLPCVSSLTNRFQNIMQ
ncbi:pentatricopeptide repeat-containing protein At5g65560-like [Pyrus x bretschneideri]|uniref:pentatricopeptide repeat-containing protein At5g65560-like n=1 Tax=Pyrus x bretschneideri TaxID=225117 RepID=UPI00202F6414|nr:pentatricopeptide repeat-containing protein At5g65560-like [Pyrus x bretschneideri]XP_048440337.1 pentatricopeptide repeat-containing protein At5g65560-like [Pyrus x bretschneideri]